MRYRYLLVDNDNTLMDFNASERHALTAALSAFDLPHDAAVCARYHQINRALWEALERGETTQAALKVERFARLLRTLPPGGAAAEALAARFQEELSRRADPDARRAGTADVAPGPDANRAGHKRRERDPARPAEPLPLHAAAGRGDHLRGDRGQQARPAHGGRGADRA